MRLALAFIFALTCALPAHAAERDETPLTLTATPVPLSGIEENVTINGRLRYLGGYMLEGDLEAFGGVSAMRFADDGATLLAITDRAQWLTMQIDGPPGNFQGVTGGWMMPMLDADGAALTGRAGDSESLVIDGETVLVGFEHRHRIARFADPFAGDENPPENRHLSGAAFAPLEDNGSFEGMTRLADGRLLVGVEEPDADGNLRLYLVGEDGAPQALSLEGISPFKLTDLVMLPTGDVLTMERRFSVLAGPGGLIRLIRGEDIQPGALLTGERIAEFTAAHTVDNYEGIAVREGNEGVEVFIISDDNFNTLQRTLILGFALDLE